MNIRGLLVHLGDVRLRDLVVTGTTIVTAPTSAPNVAPLRRWLAPPLTALVFLVHPTLSLLRPARQLQDPGTGWHLATGRYMLDTRSIVQQDLFSFTASGQPWTNYFWIFDTAAAALERLGGLPLYATVCMLLYACIPVLLYRRMVRLGASILPALLVTFAAEIVLMSHALARPHVVTYLLFAFFLERLDDVDAGRRPRRALWVLVPAMALWCNVHGGFVTGIILAGIYFGVAAVRGWLAEDATARHTAIGFAALLFALIAASGANPYGYGLGRDVLHHLNMTTTAAFDEFRSPNFQTPTIPILTFELLVIGTVAMAALARRRLAWIELALLAFFLHESLHAVRHVSLFAIVAAPLLAREVSVPLSGWRPAFAARWRAIAAEQADLRSPLVYMPVCAALFVALALAGRTGFPETLDDLQLTRGAAAFIDAHRERFARPFNTDNLGGALIYRFWPDVHVFVDDRITIYGDAFFEHEYLPVLTARPGWRDALDRNAIDAAVVSAATPAATLLRVAPDWLVAYEDDRNVIFLRRRS